MRDQQNRKRREVLALGDSDTRSNVTRFDGAQLLVNALVQFRWYQLFQGESDHLVRLVSEPALHDLVCEDDRAARVAAVAEELPPPLLAQLKPGGRMLIPVRRRFGAQELVLVEKGADEKITARDILPVIFVPLTRDPD